MKSQQELAGVLIWYKPEIFFSDSWEREKVR